MCWKFLFLQRLAWSDVGIGSGAGKEVNETVEADSKAYFSAQSSPTKTTTAKHRLTALKRYCRWAMREHSIAADASAKTPSGQASAACAQNPDEIASKEAIKYPDTDMPLELRGRSISEFMCANGLPVRRQVKLRVFDLGMNEDVLDVIGKGNKERLLPFGKTTQLCLRHHLQKNATTYFGTAANAKIACQSATVKHEADGVLVY